MITDHIYSLTTDIERSKLYELASKAPDNGVILEIGTLYGGTTAVLASAQREARVITIDNYSWHPEGYPKTSPELAEKNLEEQNIGNVEIIVGDSRKVGRKWETAIDLLWIDGGHSFDYVYSDLYLFGPLSNVIALHDYNNPAWPTIKQAVDIFVKKFTYWYLDEVVGMVAVLRRR